MAEKPNLNHALEKNAKVADEIQRAAQDLSIVNIVLEQELPDEIQVGDVAQALAHTSDLEEKLAKSAETLAKVNAALATEIEKRIEVTEQRDESIALAKKLEQRQSGASNAG
ncbi:MAG: hypothetical protein V4636_01405 [Pseudomonadota bacterium]